MMKKVIILIAAMCAAISMCSCGSTADNVIKGWEPADKQAEAAMEILGGTGEYALAEFSADSGFQSVQFGIECYKGSKLVREEELGAMPFLEGDTDQSVREGMIGYTLQGGILNLGWSYLGDTGLISNVELPGYDADSEGGFGQSPLSDSVTIKDGEKCYLSAFWQGDHGTDAEGFLDSPEVMEQNEHTWLLYCVFSSRPE